jgi:hypothetical protein
MAKITESLGGPLKIVAIETRCPTESALSGVIAACLRAFYLVSRVQPKNASALCLKAPHSKCAHPRSVPSVPVPPSPDIASKIQPDAPPRARPSYAVLQSSVAFP